MPLEESKTLSYRRARFSTELPVNYRYSPSHYWIALENSEGSVWRIGLTKFATRMLGEMVEYGFDVALKEAVHGGQVLGWVEGFKSISDVPSIAHGKFAGANPLLQERLTLINKDPYGTGWLYRVEGEPDVECVDAHAYGRILDRMIDRFLAQKK